MPPLQYADFKAHIHQRARCLVHRQPRGQTGLGGDYTPPWSLEGKALIVTCYGEGERDLPTVEELCNLAHEFGHHRRWERNERLQSYDEWIGSHPDTSQWPLEPLPMRKAV